MRWLAVPLFVMTLALIGGCGSGRVLEQSLAVGVLAAHYHSTHGDWPETREQLATVDNEQWPLDFRKSDEVWLHKNKDGSATITWVDAAW